MTGHFGLPPIGLKRHALAVSAALLLLIAILGTRGYSVARTQYREIGDLVNHDLKAEGLLVRMESQANARDQARRKLRITRDAAYAQLVTHHQGQLAATAQTLEQTLSPTHPELASQIGALKSVADITGLREQLNEKREAKLKRAREAASNLLGWLLVVLILAIGVTAWIVTLFYRGLIDPLAKLKEATARISAGELSHRVASPEAGVRELRELSRSFNSMAEKLEALDSSKTEFLATISHEIKNPLAALKEGLNLLATQGENLSPESRSKGFAACLIASKRLEFMINNMLHQSKMETGLYKFGLTLKNLSTAIQTAVDEVRPLADRKKMAIHVKAPTELEASFNWDGMVQVFENLLLNAIKYGTEQTEIEVTAQPTDRPLKRGSAQMVPHLEVSVANTGARIADAEIPKLFDPFYRGGNTGRAAGLGLGLHVVRRIIDAHHGDVRASSVPLAPPSDEMAETRIHVWIPSKYQSEMTV